MDTPFGHGGVSRKPDARDFKLNEYQTLGSTAPIPDVYFSGLQDYDVSHQGKYGTCGAHAGAHMASFMHSLNLSPKYLWKHIKQIDGIPLDNGTTMRDIFKALQNKGDCTLEVMPNDLGADVYEYSNTDGLTPEVMADGTSRKIGGYAFITRPTMTQIKKAIYEYGAVIALVDIGDGWWTPSWKHEDIMPLKLGNKVGGHFVVLYGYAKNTIFFRNSWGKDWGEDGDGWFDESYLPFVREIGTALKEVTPGGFLFKNDLRLGQRNSDVVELQKRLGVTPTGFFGTQTLSAVRKYQKAVGVMATGFVGSLTRAKLNTEYVQ